MLTSSSNNGNNVFELFNAEGDSKRQIHAKYLKQYIDNQDLSDNESEEDDGEGKEYIAKDKLQMSNENETKNVKLRANESMKSAYDSASNRITEKATEASREMKARMT